MNLSTLTTWAAQFAGDPQQTRYAGKYTNALNEAQVQFAMDSLALFKDYSFSVVANQSSYALPTDFMFEKKCTLQTTNAPTTGGITLTPVSRAEVEFYAVDQDWTQQTGTPKFYMIDPNAESGFGKSLVLYPQPQGADAGTNNGLLTYYPYPAAMVNPTDLPLNSEALMTQFHIALAAYAAWLLTAMEIASPETIAKRNALYKEYQDKVTEARDKYGNTSQMAWRLKGGRILHTFILALSLAGAYKFCNRVHSSYLAANKYFSRQMDGHSCNESYLNSDYDRVKQYLAYFQIDSQVSNAQDYNNVDYRKNVKQINRLEYDL